MLCHSDAAKPSDQCSHDFVALSQQQVVLSQRRFQVSCHAPLPHYPGRCCSDHLASAAVCLHLCCSRFPQLPGGLQPGVQLRTGVAVEMLLGLILNVVVLYATGEQGRETVPDSCVVTV